MSFLHEIESLVSAQYHVVKTAISLLKLETRLAGLSIFPLLLNLCLLLIGIMGTWTSAMLAVGYILYGFIPNLLFCILSVLFLNLGIVLGLLRYLSFNLNNMSFEKTRQFLTQTENHYVQHKKTTPLRKSANRAKTALSSNRSDDTQK
jgi:hypothetical protein